MGFGVLVLVLVLGVVTIGVGMAGGGGGGGVDTTRVATFFLGGVFGDLDFTIVVQSSRYTCRRGRSRCRRGITSR